MTASSTRAAEPRIARLAARQAGAFSRAQALTLGFTDSSIIRRIHAGVWVRTHPGVYALAEVPPTWNGEVWAAFLTVGPMAARTHETSLRIHGSEHMPLRPVTLTVPHGGHARVRGAFVHQIDDLHPAHVTTVDGLPVSTAARAVVEVAATLGSRQLGRALDDLVFNKRTQYLEVAARLAEVARPGKPGVAKLAAALDERSDEGVPPGSELERAMVSALVGGGLPVPQRQVALPGVGPVDGLVDAAYPEARLILEADGRRWHTRVRDLARDHARDNQAARAGWQTLRFVYEAICHDPEGVCATVADVLAVRLPRPPGAGLAIRGPAGSRPAAGMLTTRQ